MTRIFSEIPMDKQLYCPKCKTQLPVDSPFGLCPKCLLEQGLEETLDHHPKRARFYEEGSRLGPYEIGPILGSGGMGTVYLATEVETGRRLALKVLDHRLESEKHRRRFLREGRLAASLNHENTVYIFGTHEISGAPVIAMELAMGGTLEELVKQEGPLGCEKAVDLILQVIEGLEAAAKTGILHRDIKPANCFIHGDDQVEMREIVGLDPARPQRRQVDPEPCSRTDGP